MLETLSDAFARTLGEWAAWFVLFVVLATFWAIGAAGMWVCGRVAALFRKQPPDAQE